MIAFTICSNNYLAKAQVLLKSLKAKEDVTVYLFLADQQSAALNYLEMGFDKVVIPEELGIPNLHWQLENYNIIELNTALKGPAFKYLLEHTNAETLYYLDPDIKVYQPLSEFNKYWDNKSILLTPHLLSPIPFDGMFPGENLFLNHGIYNLGFLGLKRSAITDRFLQWWNERLAQKCIIDLKEGFFTDQIWLNLAPLYFKEVNVLCHAGFNAAYWNLHDRIIDFNNGFPKVNLSEDLFFYHFSSFDSKLKHLTPTDRGRYSFINRSEMQPLYQDYLNDLTQFDQIDYKSFIYYGGKYPLPKQQEKQHLIKRILKRLLR